ncbi:hypothetical protein IX46_00400 [Buchnera aphidicola (Aphis glycines)]|uniref:Flagellar FliJ protein n=1 Tax=Buchnera aphidicola (Aphis glycines) TaxID=1265350 RepID=A0A0M4HUX4_9GAMM|nr:flagellar FliJ family protein [Buchnera aphidicola]ALD15042.1 hypothetical protein IX46_00400 [Buchnera aphidicola (Aphis glycines)]
MKYKKILFCVLKNIEEKKIKQKAIYIQNLHIQKKKYIEQLKLLINFRNEYITKLNINVNLGMPIYYWRVYKNFISMLYNAVEENNDIIKTYEKKIKKNIDQWLKNHIKLKTWNYLNQKSIISFQNRYILEEHIINDEFSQLKFFKKGSYYDLKSYQ